MKKTAVLIFGNNEYGLEIARNVTYKYNNITIFSSDDIDEIQEENSEFKFENFDLSDDWDDIIQEYDIEKSIIFCALNDEAENIFLTISLRAAFENINIIALANNNEDANKLRIAGASKVIPIVETTADIITDMLKKPVITEVMHDILYESTDLQVEQIKVGSNSPLDGKYPSDIEWSRDHGVIVLSIIHEDMSSEFIYSSKSKHHSIKDGDIFVAVGYEKDLDEFKKLMEGS